MGPLGEKKTYVVSPPFEGYLYDGEKPLANKKIIREIYYYGNTNGITETYTTDETGYFKIPVIEVVMRLSFLSQFTASTALYVDEIDQVNLFWNSFSGEGNKYSQFLDISPTNFQCDLSRDELYRGNGVSSFVAKCIWNNMPKPDPEWEKIL